jgi:hypothetical protein
VSLTPAPFPFSLQKDNSMSTETAIAPRTATEHARRTQLEETIEAGQKTFLEVGAALLEIRDKRLYRGDFETFEEYCQTKWNFGRNYSNKLIEAVKVVSDLPVNLGTIVTTETQARELAKVPKKQRAKVIQAASENGTKPVTAKKIADAAKSFAPPPIKKAAPGRADKFGHPIEDPGAWDHAEAVASEVLKKVSDVRVALKELETDRIFAELPPTILSTVSGLYANLKAIQPHTVCPRHDGAKCKLCNGRGFISKSKYENVIKPADREKWEAQSAVA